MAEAGAPSDESLDDVQRRTFARATVQTIASCPRERRLTAAQLISFLDRQAFAVVATTRPGGRPHDPAAVLCLRRRPRVITRSAPPRVWWRLGFPCLLILLCCESFLGGCSRRCYQMPGRRTVAWAGRLLAAGLPASPARTARLARVHDPIRHDDQPPVRSGAPDHGWVFARSNGSRTQTQSTSGAAGRG
jgi:hypothetical protein